MKRPRLPLGPPEGLARRYPGMRLWYAGPVLDAVEMQRLEPGTTKNREGRAFPITPALRAILEHRLEFTRRCERMQGRIIPWVFHREGEPVKSRNSSTCSGRNWSPTSPA